MQRHCIVLSYYIYLIVTKKIITYICLFFYDSTDRYQQ